MKTFAKLVAAVAGTAIIAIATLVTSVVVADKVEKLPKRRGISVKTALVYEGHLAPIVEADGYFDAIVPFRTLLGL